MSKLDISNIYKDRIKQIEKDIKKAIHDKKWSEIAKLEVEKVKLEGYISNE